MSHFSVLVVGPDIEAQLAPYQENNMGDCPRQYMIFHDQEDEFRQEYKTGSIEMVRLEDGTHVYPWDERFRVSGKFGLGTNTHEVPAHLQKEKVFHKDRYPNFETFCRDWHGISPDGETGRYGYWDNPDKKWDWYVVGGRYSGKLKLKDGASGIKGRRSWTNENEYIPHQFVDSARIGDIDWEGMNKARLEQYQQYWLEAATKSEQERDWMYGIKPGMTCEQYLAKANDFSVFAVVKDGKWYQRGDMGWWGVVSDEKDEDAWKAELQALLKELPEDTLITIVDCHI